MLVKQGMEVYPLRQARLQIGENVIYDRNARNKSWFILDLESGGRLRRDARSGQDASSAENSAPTTNF